MFNYLKQSYNAIIKDTIIPIYKKTCILLCWAISHFDMPDKFKSILVKAPLLIAVVNNDSKMAEIPVGRTPLLHAILKNDSVTVKHLVNHGVNLNPISSNKITMLDYASRGVYRNLEIVEILVRNGADFNHNKQHWDELSKDTSEACRPYIERGLAVRSFMPLLAAGSRVTNRNQDGTYSNLPINLAKEVGHMLIGIKPTLSN